MTPPKVFNFGKAIAYRYMSRALGMCASKAMCAKTTTISTEWIEAAMSWPRETTLHHWSGSTSEVRKHQELALHRFIDGNDFFVSPPTGSGKSVCYWMLQAAFNALRDRADTFSTPSLHSYRVALPIIAFHVVTEYGPETPDPFSPPHFRPRPPTRGKRVWLARLRLNHDEVAECEGKIASWARGKGYCQATSTRLLLLTRTYSIFTHLRRASNAAQ